jgi:hypothetical protein
MEDTVPAEEALAEKGELEGAVSEGEGTHTITRMQG